MRPFFRSVESRRAWLSAAMLGLAVCLGGGGSPAPLPEVLVQVASALLGTIWFVSWRGGRVPVPAPALAIAAMLVALPLVQLIPLPPFVWQALPGRLQAVDALALVGRGDTWQSLSLDRARTLVAALAVVPPALMLIMTATLDRSGRGLVVKVLAAAGVATLLVGAAQVSQGATSPLRFYGTGSPYLEGFQANHNSTADILLLSLVAGMALVRRSALRREADPGFRKWILGAALAIMLVAGTGIYFTASRMGMALLPIAAIAGFILLRPWLPGSRLAVVGGALALAGTFGAASLLLARNDAFGRVADRYTLTAELRPELWKDGLYAARTYFPAGVGMGNFVPALMASERLEVVRPTSPNRAHNDYLELLVESGLLGLAALTAITAILGRGLRHALRDRSPLDRTTVIVGTAGLAILALHSLVDYPLRSMSIAMAAAACAGLILAPRVAMADGSQSGKVEHES